MKPTQPSTQSEKDEPVKIFEHPYEIGPERRTVFNKPTLPQGEDYAPNSPEARIADATTQFGLNFMSTIPADSNRGNVVISPLSLECILNMLLLATSDNSTTQSELIKVLNYDRTDLLGSAKDRLKPHEAMHNVFENIMRATHLSVNANLLNANTGELSNESGTSSSGTLAAHLQTSLKENDTPLTQQVNFTLANLVLTNKDFLQLDPSYEQDLKKYYDVTMEEFDRVNSNKTASKPSNCLPLHERVNNWVKKKTQNQIDKIASESDLSPDDLIMVLLNAAHFKGRWLHTFSPKATREMTFFNNGLEQGATTTMFMRQKGVFGYADFGSAALQEGSDGKMSSSEDAETLLTLDVSDLKSGSPANQAPVIELSREESKRLELTSKLNCSVLMLPFSLNDGQELSMVILLPTKRDGLPELQAALSGPALNEIYRSLGEQQVQVELPKFSFEGSHDAKSGLLSLGLKTIFGDGADFDRLYKANSTLAKVGARVDKIIHKAKISVDETGAEAAAASMAAVVLRNFIRPPSPVFVADHPFLFVIRHNRSNMPLFMGRVNSL